MPAQLTLQDITNVHDLSSLARMFHRLGYQTEDDFDVATHHPDEAGLSESVSKHIHRLGIVWSQDDLHIIHFFLNELKGRVFRGIANDMLARPGNYLLTFSPRSLSRLVIVKPIRAGGKIHLGRLDVSLRPPSSEALKVLRQIAIDPVDASGEANARQIEVFTALEESFDLEESPLTEDTFQDIPQWFNDTDFDEADAPRYTPKKQIKILNRYTTELVRESLLTAKEEVALAHRIDLGEIATEELADQLNIDAKQLKLALYRTVQNGHLSYTVLAQELSTDDSNEHISEALLQGYKHLIQQARVGLSCRQRLVTTNLRLAKSIAWKFQGLGIELLDLIQEANLGLMRAADKFEPSYGTKFSTYATWWIRQAITRALADKSRAIRIPVGAGGDLRKLERLEGQLSMVLGREPNATELAEKMGEDWDAEKVYEYLMYNDRASHMMSLSDEEIEEVAEYIPFEGIEPLAFAEFSELSDIIENVFKQAKLSDKEIEVMKRRNGFYDNQEYTLEATGELLGVTRERIRQIQNQAERKLRYHESRRPILHEYKDELDDLPDYRPEPMNTEGWRTGNVPSTPASPTATAKPRPKPRRRHAASWQNSVKHVPRQQQTELFDETTTPLFAEQSKRLLARSGKLYKSPLEAIQAVLSEATNTIGASEIARRVRALGWTVTDADVVRELAK